MSTVSIVMNCYNGARYLREALASIKAQTYQDWEIIFWDNASTDGSDAIAKSFGERLRYFRSETTTTLGEGRNRAFAQASGDYIAVLDVDDLWLPTKLEKQIPLLEKDPEVGLVFCDSFVFDEHRDLFRLFQHRTPHRGHVFGELLQSNFMYTVSMLYRRAFLNRLKPLFNPDFKIVIDYELSLRMAYTHKLDFVNEPLTRQRIHPERECERNRFLGPCELTGMLTSFQQTLPDFPQGYEGRLAVLRRDIDFQLALEQWTKGNITAARNFFKKHYRKSRKHLLGLVASCIYPFTLPPSLLTALKNMAVAIQKKIA